MKWHVISCIYVNIYTQLYILPEMERSMKWLVLEFVVFNRHWYFIKLTWLLFA